ASKIAVLGRAARVDGGLSTAVRMSGVGPELLDRLAIADAVALRRGNHESSPINLANAAKAVAALRRCTAEQLVEWGADPAQFQAGGTLPTALVSREVWLTNSQLIGLAAGRSEVRASLNGRIAVGGAIDWCTAAEDGADARVA